jgi:hypothetical protein
MRVTRKGLIDLLDKGKKDKALSKGIYNTILKYSQKVDKDALKEFIEERR